MSKPDQAHATHAGLLGSPGPPIVHNGRTYRCGPHSQEAKLDVERRLTAQAMRAAALAPPEFRAEAMAAVAADAASGAYGYYGAASQRAMLSPSGILILIGALFGITDDEALDLFNARPDEAKALVDLAILEGLPEAARLNVLAKRKAGASEGDRPTPAAPA